MKIFVFIFLLLSFSSAYSQPLRIVTEKLPPLQFTQNDGLVTGAMVEVIDLLLSKTDLKSEIEILPWARSYQIASERKNTLIFSMMKGEGRENKFIWIGKIFAMDSYLVALKNDKNFEINTIEDAKKYSVGSIRQDFAQLYLRRNGFIEDKNLYLSSNYTVLWQMLYSNRTDLVSTNSILWRYELEDSHLDPEQVRIVYKIPDIATDLYLAASLGTDESIISALKKELDVIKSNGQYQQILLKWQLDKTHN